MLTEDYLGTKKPCGLNHRERKIFLSTMKFQFQIININLFMS